jgi:hypothetical protein
MIHSVSQGVVGSLESSISRMSTEAELLQLKSLANTDLVALTERVLIIFNLID